MALRPLPIAPPPVPRLPRALPRLLSVLAGALLLWSCILVRKVRVDEVRAPVQDSVQVKSPVKAHMLDGSTILYPNGVFIRQGRLIGAGQRYGLRVQFVEVVQAVPADSVVGMERYRSATDEIATAGLSLVAGTIGALAVTAAAAAIFGSCPTFYSDSAGTPVLEAEGFSYSIAPLFEARDVDRLRVRAGPDGLVRVEVRNEALETHFLNRLELFETIHDRAEVVVPDARGVPLALGGMVPPLRAQDRSGRDHASALESADGVVFASDTSRLAGATVLDHEDFIDLAFPPPVAGPDSLGLVLRLRNSLLNTVLLYDVMLGARGGRALDWQADDLARIGPALELGSWYTSRMGLRVLVPDGRGFREVGRVKDTGPIAWKDVAVPLPPASGDTVRVRLAFVTDNWRIDRVLLAGRLHRPAARTIPLSRVETAGGRRDTIALAAMQLPDKRYLETQPGQRFTAVWAVGPEPAGGTRTFLLASQGFYTEWIRGDWLATGKDTAAFAPTDASLVQAMRKWRGAQDSLERRFYASRIPVR
jgi:hypothetical protein